MKKVDKKHVFIVGLLLIAITIPTYIASVWWNSIEESFPVTGYSEELKEDYNLIHFGALLGALTKNRHLIEVINASMMSTYNDVTKKIGSNESDKEIFKSWLLYLPYITTTIKPNISPNSYINTLKTLSMSTPQTEYGIKVLRFESAAYAAILLKRSTVEYATPSNLAVPSEKYLAHLQSASQLMSSVSSEIDCQYVDDNKRSTNSYTTFFKGAFMVWDGYLFLLKNKQSPENCRDFPLFLSLVQNLKSCLSVIPASEKGSLEEIAKVGGQVPHLKEYIQYCGEEYQK